MNNTQTDLMLSAPFHNNIVNSKSIVQKEDHFIVVFVLSIISPYNYLTKFQAQNN